MIKKFLTFFYALALAPVISLTAGHSEAFVSLQAVGDSQVSGQVRFSAQKEGLRIYGYIEGLTPGSHGLHIHEKGECQVTEGAQATSPKGAETGHIADLGNINADEDGIAEFHFENDNISLEGPKSVVGKTLILFEGESTTGERVACGAIQQQI